MSSDNILFLVVIGLIILTAYLAATKPEITAQEREEMEKDWWS